MYSPAANQVALSQNGVQALLFSGSQQATFAGNAVFPSGTAAAPSVQIGTTAGLYSSGANTLSFSVGAAALFSVDNLSNNVQFSNLVNNAAGSGYFFYAGNGGLAASIDASNGIMARTGGISASAAGGNAATGTVRFDGTSSANGANAVLQAATVQSGTLAGASVTLSNLIPAGSLVLGVVGRVTTAITGATSFGVGDAAAGTQYGANVAIALGTTFGLTGVTLTSPKFYPSATSVVLTANGSNFTGGVVRVTVYYVSLTAPTS